MREQAVSGRVMRLRCIMPKMLELILGTFFFPLNRCIPAPVFKLKFFREALSRNTIYIFSRFFFMHFLLLRLQDLYYCVASVKVHEGLNGIRICGAVLPDPEMKPRWCGVCGALWGPWGSEERFL